MADVNQTFLVLIPNLNRPEYIHKFHPISLCNFNHKIVSKILVNRLKCVMPPLISNSQSSFVLGRQITNNIMVAQEIIHSMKSMKRSKGYIATKIDLEKAYDRLQWDFIRDTLEDVGILMQLNHPIIAALNLLLSRFFGMVVHLLKSNPREE